jgi:hypothetical protein
MTASLIDAGHRRLAMIAPATPPLIDQFSDLCDEVAAARLPAARLIEAGDNIDRFSSPSFAVPAIPRESYALTPSPLTPLRAVYATSASACQPT